MPHFERNMEFARMMRRRLAPAWIAVLAWAGAAVAGDRTLIFQFQWYPQAQFAGYLMADAKGFFLQEGLSQIRLEYSRGDERPLRRVMRGEIDFCTGWVSPALAEHVQAAAADPPGDELVNLAQIMQKSALLLVARKTSGIEHPRDMTGRRVGIWKGDFTIPFLAFFRKEAIRPEIVQINYSTAPFLRGAVEVSSVMFYNEYHRLREAGTKLEDLRTFSLADFGMNFPEDGVYTTAAMRDRKPRECRAVVAASLRGWAYAIAHEEETLDVVMRACDESHLATNRNHQRWMLRAMGELIRHGVGDDPAKWGTLSKADYDNVAEELLKQRLISKIPAYSQFFRPPAAAPFDVDAGRAPP